MSEFTPVWRKPQMTRAQVRKYQKEMEEKRLEAQRKLDEAKQNWDYYAEDLGELEKELDNL